MSCVYGGRLGRITAHYPKVQCEECGTFQVQITSYLVGDPEYKCRYCKHKFTLPFEYTDTLADDCDKMLDLLSLVGE